MDINHGSQKKEEDSVEVLIQKLHEKGTKVKIVKDGEDNPTPTKRENVSPSKKKKDKKSTSDKENTVTKEKENTGNSELIEQLQK